MHRVIKLDIATKKLTEAPLNQDLQIVAIEAGSESRHRMNSMGFHIGDILVKIDSNRWGPVLIQNVTNHATKIAIGRALAEKIIVTFKI